MREIKFRAWDPEADAYRYDVSVSDGMAESSWGKEKPEWILEQFTGLHDRNGKEIYEGDILRDQYGNVGPCYWIPSTWEFINTGGCVESGERWEIIGNIHESPELLT